MLGVIVRCYWQVATFKETPASTPYSVPLLVFVAFSFLMLLELQWFMADIKQQFEISLTIAMGITLIIAYALFTFLLLKINHKVNRVVQTLASLLACHFIVHIFAIPLLLVAPALSEADMNHGFAILLGIIYLILTLILTVWQFLVTAHVYKYALEVDNLAAFLASFGLLACNILTVSFWR